MTFKLRTAYQVMNCYTTRTSGSLVMTMMSMALSKLLHTKDQEGL